MFEFRRADKCYYCFSEAKKLKFGNVSEQILSAWLVALNVEKHECTADEKEVLKTLSVSEPYQLIEKNDLAKIERMYIFCSNMPFYYNYPLVPFRSTENSDSVVCNVPNFKEQCVSKPLNTVETANGSRENDRVAGVTFHHVEPRLGLIECNVNEGVSREGNTSTGISSTSSDIIAPAPSESCELIPNQNESQDCSIVFNTEPGISTLTEENFQDISAQNKEKLSETKNQQQSGRRSACTLNPDDMSQELRSKIEHIKRFYSVQVNFQRQGPCFQPSTLSKMTERLSTFLWFLKHVKGLEPDIFACENAELVQDFVNHMTAKRNTKASTCSRYITALVSVVKVLNADRGRKSDDHLNVEQLRSIQRQLERIGRQEKLFEDSSKPMVERKIIYSEILELCRELKWSFEETKGMQQARHCMNLSLLLLYTSANPGRTREFVSLRIYSGQVGAETRDQNFIIFGQDESVTLLENSYKTARVYGSNRTELTDFPTLAYYLKLYLTKMRPQLILGKVHDYFFVNTKGDPFTTSSYSVYISALFEKHFSMKVSTHDLRKAVLNYFLSLPSAGDYALRESLAAVMKHSVRTQKRFYDERPLAQKKARALDILGDLASRTLNGEQLEAISQESQDGCIEILPGAGEMVALVAANSTASRPEVFVARVLRLSDDRLTLWLAQFEEIEESKFKLTPGKTYRESTNSVIYPVDIVYDHCNHVYHLRTSKIEIHNQVRQEQ